MKFALLGTDSESIALARAAAAAGQKISWCGDVTVPPDDDVAVPPERAPGYAGSVSSCAGRVSGWAGGGRCDWPLDDCGEEWESLLDQSMVAAVIVGRGRAAAGLRGEQVNQLVKNGVALLTTFPLVDSVLTYYEIDMSRGESGAVLQHFNPLTEQQPIIDQCADWIAHAHPRLGAIEQVVWERPLAERTREQVLWNFSRDVELLSQVAGRLNRLGALGSPDEAATYAGLSVQLLGAGKVPVRWQLGPIEQAARPRLVLIANRGKLSVTFDEAGQALRLSVSQDGQSQTTALEAVDAAAQAMARFIEAVAVRDGDASTWARALQAMELTDTIEISLRRGRMIEVHQQQLTEQLAFKGTMSALGCGILLVVPPTLLCFGWLAELMGLSVSRFWPHVLLTVLALFLGLQLIPKLLFGRPDQGADDQGVGDLGAGDPGAGDLGAPDEAAPDEAAAATRAAEQKEH